MKFTIFLICALLLIPTPTWAVLLETTQPWTPEMQKKAESGDTASQRLLGLAYELGSGVEPNGVEAEKWLRKAGAKREIGRMYKYGQVVKEDYAVAMRWFQEAAVDGDARAKIEMGIMYEGGQGVNKDTIRAEKLFREAAEEGDGEVKFEIGMRYKDGAGVKKDCAEAMKWIFKAADEDSPGALLTISEAYQNHGCMPEDKQESFYWRSFWYGLLNKEPDESVNTKDLTVEQRVAIQRRVKAWIQAHPLLVKKAQEFRGHIPN